MGGNTSIVTGQDVVDQYATANTAGTLVTFDFGSGDSLEVQQSTGLTMVTLGTDILIA